MEKVTIMDVAAEGKAIAKVDDLVIFVPYVVPGDVVDLQIKRKKNKYAEAEAVKFHELSPNRAVPFCQHYGVCGGCKWQGKKSRRVYVSCVNKDKGAVARKACTVSCIGCGKCVKTCPFEAITLENNLAYIDPNKCKSCRKCVEVCPQNSIIELNFPPRKPKEEAPAAPKPAAKVETPAAKATEAPKVTE